MAEEDLGMLNTVHHVHLTLGLGEGTSCITSNAGKNPLIKCQFSGSA
jgi:hypothetical protein